MSLTLALACVAATLPAMAHEPAPSKAELPATFHVSGFT